jgi:hypothetical protein
MRIWLETVIEGDGPGAEIFCVLRAFEAVPRVGEIVYDEGSGNCGGEVLRVHWRKGCPVAVLCSGTLGLTEEDLLSDGWKKGDAYSVLDELEP